MRPLIHQPWFARTMAPLLVGILLLVVWQGSCVYFQIPKYLFPAPTDIAASFREGWPVLLHGLWSTLKVTLIAFAASIIFGTLTSFLFIQSRLIELSLLPYAVLLQVTPIVAVAPLIIILVKDTAVALTLCATVIAIFPIISNTTIGLRSVDPGLLAYFRMNKASRMATLWRLRIPGGAAVLPGGPAHLLGAGAWSARWWRSSSPAPVATVRRPRLRDHAILFPARYPAHVRSVTADHGHRRGAVRPHGVAAAGPARPLARERDGKRTMNFERTTPLC